MAIKALNGFGWFLTGAIVAPACYLVSSQVAAERTKVEAVERAIIRAHKDIRGLETEFDTRANLAQLERWNGEVMRYSAPTPVQFLASDRELASLRPMEGDGMANRYAAMVTPHDMPQVISGARSASDSSDVAVAAPDSSATAAGAAAGVAAAAVAQQAVAPKPRATSSAQPKVDQAKVDQAKVDGAKPGAAKRVADKVEVAKASAPKPTPAKSSPAKPAPAKDSRARDTQLASAATPKSAKPSAGPAASARPAAPSRPADTRVASLRPIPVPGTAAAKPQTAAGLERKLLKDSSFGDLMKDVRAEARRQR